MLHTENVIVIEAPPDEVFELAARIEDWPSLLAHYRYVHIQYGREEHTVEGRARVATMSASRMRIPVKWTSTQMLDQESGRIIYRHIGGVTRGMAVEWRIEALASGSYVTIVHDLEKPEGILRLAAARKIAGAFFVHAIADRTLRGIRNRAEAQARQRAVR